MANHVMEYINQKWPEEKPLRIHVLNTIAYFADLKGEAKPSLSTLIKRLHMPLRTAQRYLHSLEKDGFITIEKNKGMPTSTGKTNLYTFPGFAEWYQVNRGMPTDTQGMPNSAETYSKGMPLSDERDATGVSEGVQSCVALEVLKDKVSTEVKDSEIAKAISTVPQNPTVGLNPTPDTSRSQENFGGPQLPEAPMLREEIMDVKGKAVSGPVDSVPAAVEQDPNPVAPPPSPPDEMPYHAPQKVYMGALAAAFGYDLKTMTKSLKSRFGDVARQLRETRLHPDKIEALHKFVEKQAKEGNWKSWTVNALVGTWLEEFKKDLNKPRYEFYPIWPPGFTPPTYEPRDSNTQYVSKADIDRIRNEVKEKLAYKESVNGHGE